MKHNLMKKLSLLLLILIAPCTFLLCACGPTPTNEARSVRFVSNISQYETDEEGNNKAIFELDLNVPTYLDFSVSPSSWSGYRPTYDYLKGGDGENRQRFKFDEGVFTINSADFKPVDLGININGHTDRCQVRLREYPEEIFYAGHQTELFVSSGEMLQIKPFARFSGSDEPVELSSENFSYKYLVETSNETLISVPDPNILKVYVTQKLPNEKVTIQVHMLNQKGEKILGLGFSLKITIGQMAKYGYLDIEGADRLVFDGQTEPVELDASEFLVEGNNYQLNYKFVVVSEKDVKIEGFDYLITCTNADCSEDGVIKFTKPAGNELEIKVKIFCTDLYTSTYKTYTYIASLKIKF